MFKMINAEMFKKFFLFTFISGLGLVLSFVCLWAGVHFFALSAFWANCIGDVCAVSFVFFMSSYKVFFHNGRHMTLKFAVWLAYSCLMILAISFGVQYGQRFDFGRAQVLFRPDILAKAFIAPFSLLVNFLFAKFLLENIRR